MIEHPPPDKHEACPAINWQVVNCGGISYASYRLRPIMQECLQYSPDMYIVCTGHNEFLECVTYAQVRHAAPVVKRSVSWLSQFHSFRALKSVADRCSSDSRRSELVVSQSGRLPQEVDAILDHQGGLDAYRRDALQSDVIVSQFGANLQSMIDLSREAGLPLLVMLPPSSLSDCPPFKSEFSAESGAELRAQITMQLSAVAKRSGSDADSAVRELETIASLDGQFAFSWYQLGHALLDAHRPEDALKAFIRARDEDVCPLRMTSELENQMRQVASDNDVPLLDIQHLLAPKSRQQIVGDATLVDHIHPSFRGHQEIAFAVAQHLSQQVPDLFEDAPATDWHTAAQQDFDQHLQSLPDMYFLRGQRTLQNLRAWTQGRAEGPPLVPETHEPKAP